MIFFIDGSLNNHRLTTDGARRFFELQYMPANFHRQLAPVNFINNYKELPNTPALSNFCSICKDIVLHIVPALYPHPTNDLKKALNKNLNFFFSSIVIEYDCK
ncbi:hypothetical protein M422DRAFT_254279 [Sphaerobolus stellatus SS14]|uniref:Uncharacterized protein n=1 Tax=Sphaerobolus stellatus (strain SS14) TaxID=990650 RepID=A0A0C9UHH2_SPHS4|nr:hypothetical protein M422DRAFT_254279 [Sphaerobolus stellatus SS14]